MSSKDQIELTFLEKQKNSISKNFQIQLQLISGHEKNENCLFAEAERTQDYFSLADNLL